MRNDEGKAYAALGHLYWAKEDYANAIKKKKKNYAIQSELDNIEGVMSAHYDLGKTYVKLANYRLALEHFHQGLPLAKKIELSDWILSFYEILSETYSTVEDFRKAYAYKDSAYTLNDSLS